MTTRQAGVYFYAGLSIIMVVNLIFASALIIHTFFGRPTLPLEWMLGVFGTEMIGAFLYTWREITRRKASAKSDLRVYFEEEQDENGVIKLEDAGGDESKTFVTRKTDYDKIATEKDLENKEAGDRLLVVIRKPGTERHKILEKGEAAIGFYSLIPRDSKIYVLAQYQIATVERVMKRRAAAVKRYRSVTQLLLEEGHVHFSAEEVRVQLADTEMMIGNVRSEQKRLAEARDCFLGSWKTNPRNYIAVLNLLENAFKRNDLAEAEVWAEILRTYAEYSSFEQLVESYLKILRRK